MPRLKEFFQPKALISRLGALTFGTGIFKEETRTPHYEMIKCMEMMEQRPMVASGLISFMRFVIGDRITIESKDEKTKNFLRAWVAQRKHLETDIFNCGLMGLATGNGYFEKVYIESENKQSVLDNLFHIPDSSRVFYYLQYDSINEFWIYEVPWELQKYTDKHGKEMTPRYYMIKYVYGSYLWQKHVYGVPVHRDIIAHYRSGWSRDGIYGRGRLAPAIDNNEVMTEILKNFSVIARYRALGKKIFSLGDDEDQASIEDLEDLEEQLKTLEDEDHMIINKKLQATDLSYQGQNDSMETQMDFLRRDTATVLIPTYLTPWADTVTRTGAAEGKVPFELELNNFQKEYIRFLNELIIDELRKTYTWIAQDASFSFGKVDLENRTERVNYMTMLYQAGGAKLTELRKAGGLDYLPGTDRWASELRTQQPEQPMDDVEAGIEDKKADADIIKAEKPTREEKFKAVVQEDGFKEKHFNQIGDPKKPKIKICANCAYNKNGHCIMNNFTVDSKDSCARFDYSAPFLMARIKAMKEKMKDGAANQPLNNQKPGELSSPRPTVDHELNDDVGDGVQPTAGQFQAGLKKNLDDQPLLKEGELDPRLFATRDKIKLNLVKLTAQRKMGQHISDKEQEKVQRYLDTRNMPYSFNNIMRAIKLLVESSPLLPESMSLKEKIDHVHKEASKLDTFSELIDKATAVKKLMMKFGDSDKLSSSIWGTAEKDNIRKLIFDNLNEFGESEVNTAELKQKLKDELIRYQKIGGKTFPTHTDAEVERIARTELNSLNNMQKLLKWKMEGWTKVKHITFVTPVTGKKDLSFNNKIFDIDYLLTHSTDRNPLHPNCRCTYSPWS